MQTRNGFETILIFLEKGFIQSKNPHSMVACCNVSPVIAWDAVKRHLHNNERRIINEYNGRRHIK